MAFRPMTHEWKMQIVADLKSGMLIADIRKKHGISWARLSRIQNEFGLQRHRGYHKILNDDHADYYEWFAREWDAARKRIIGDKDDEVQKDDPERTRLEKTDRTRLR